MNGKYYYKFSKGVQKGTCRIIAIDTETAKNWRAENKFIPFCASFFSIYYDPMNTDKQLNIDDLYVECEIYFRDETHDTATYLNNVNSMIGKYLASDNTTVVGHQLTSDLFSLKNLSNEHLDSVETLITEFKNRRKTNSGSFRVADTRYDIPSRVIGDEKLRNVSLRLNIFAIQFELDKASLTKQYNLYLVDGDKAKRERLIVMNLRHAFQTALVWLCDNICYDKTLYNCKFGMPFLATNDIIHDLCKDTIEYVSAEEYMETLEIAKIFAYVRKYMPNHDMLKEDI